MNNQHDNQRHQILRSYSIYRFILAIALLTLLWAGVAPQVIGEIQFDTFLTFSYILAFVSVAGVISSLTQAFKVTDAHVVFWLMLDIFSIVGLLSASGGIESSLMPLFMIVVVIGAMLLEAELVFLISSLAVVGLYLVIIIAPSFNSESKLWFSIASWGVGFFTLSYGVRLLAKKLRAAEESSVAQSIIIEELQQINQRIIMRMNTGVLVLDEAQRMKLINPSALRLLQLEESAQSAPLDITPLCNTIDNWKADKQNYRSICEISETSTLNVGIVELQEQNELLIFLEDNSRIQHQVEQLKLAALGHLTASIAHEIRNPIGAISYARGLLEESQALDDEEREMLSVIHRQEQRIDRIIKRTFELSKNEQVSQTLFSLREFLNALVDEYCTLHQINRHEFKLPKDLMGIEVEFDRDHLRQILINLIDNAKTYGELPISFALRTYSGALILDVHDQGQPLDDKQAQRIFEPFYTSSTEGAGLGLYICKQLCVANKANLHYSRFEGHSRFSIVISNWESSSKDD